MIIRKFTAMVMALLLMISFAGCKEQKHYRIGVSQCSFDDWRQKMNDEIYRELLMHPEVEVEIRSADDNNDKQISDIQYFMDNGFDLIIAVPNEAEPITPVIKKVYDAGIPVIIFDRGINGGTYTAWLGADNMEIGRQAARYGAHLTGYGTRVLEICGLKGSTPAIDRHEGFASEAARLGLVIAGSAYGDWNPDDACRVTDSLLNIYPDIDLIYAHNDCMAIAASGVVRDRGLDIRIIGIDAIPEVGLKAVSEGVIDATFLYPTDGYQLVRTALAVLNGEKVEKDITLPVASAVDKSNADILMLQNNMLNEETEKIKHLKNLVDDYLARYDNQTMLFYLVVVILVLLLAFLFMLLRAFWQHKRHKKLLMEKNRIVEDSLETERALNERLNVATQSKLVFFTNVSHDLRTPLTLVAEPVAQLAAADYLTPQHHALMKIADKNVKILMRLINQILDFRKYENGKIEINLSEINIAEAVGDWIESFASVARKRDIRLSLDVNVDDGDFTMAVDAEKLERVMFNLVSNAFKYTPDNGRISVACRLEDDTLIMSVSDTGEGIPEEDLGNIFDRFYQVDKIHPRGSGIGLSLAKAFIELHGGTIEVTSELGKGSTFTVRLPVRHVAPTDQAVARVITADDVNVELGAVEKGCEAGDDSKPLLLVIDDNADIRRMIAELLKDEYRIIEAADGKKGISMASKYVPDLIICDVMMPVMDGMECCRRIKNEMNTSHIPVLMLTACSMDEQRIQGYESGADGYLAKPFNSTMLRMRCRNLIDNRKRIEVLWKTGGVEPSRERQPKAMDIDDEFYSRFLAIVETGMSDQNLNVDDIATRLNMSRSQFYRKLKALTNYSPVELLRKLRLTKARELLISTRKTISEVAFEVGFADPAYFTRVFHKSYGETPTELRERLGHS